MFAEFLRKPVLKNGSELTLWSNCLKLCLLTVAFKTILAQLYNKTTSSFQARALNTGGIYTVFVIKPTLFFETAIIFIIFWDFLMFYQIFLSPQVKLCAIITYKHGMYEFPHELPINLKLRILGNQETSGKFLNFTKWQRSTHSPR